MQNKVVNHRNKTFVWPALVFIINFGIIIALSDFQNQVYDMKRPLGATLEQQSSF